MNNISVEEVRKAAARKAIKETMEEEVWDFLNCRAENILMSITNLGMGKQEAEAFVDAIIASIHAEYDLHREAARKHGL